MVHRRLLSSPCQDQCAQAESGQAGGGAKPGHRGHGRQTFDESGADRVVGVESEVGDRCPRCGNLLEDKGTENYCVIDIPPLKTERILYRLPKRYCPRCRKSYQPSAPGVLPKSLYGNQLIATSATMHYLHGIPMGRIIEQIDIGALLIITWQREIFAPRSSPIKSASALSPMLELRPGAF